MKKKLITILILFLAMLWMGTINSHAYQTLGQIERLALYNLDAFLTAPIENITDGNTDVHTRSRAVYCMDVGDHTGANRNHMVTSVVDVGANGVGSVNHLNTKDSDAARKAMEVLYYATKSYAKGEPWGATSSSPYRMMMQYRSAYYANIMVRAGLFNWSLPSSGYDMTYGKFPAGKPEQYTAEAQAYVASTTNYAFKDKSTPNIQTIEEKGDWVFVGPYRIQNTGIGYISEITVTTTDGRTCRPDGWSTSVDEATIRNNINLPNGTQFYLAFKNQKPDSIEKVVVKKRADNVLRARMVFFASDGGQNLAVYGGKLNTDITDTINLPVVSFTNIKLKKVDEDSEQALQNVGFIVYNETLGKWVKDGVPAKYVDSKEEATTYKTNNNGEVTIRGLNKRGTYKIYEIINPNFGYIETSIESPCEEITVEINAIGQSISKTIANKRRYVKLSGYAWEDIATGKKSELNHVYNESEKDQRLRNITVTLRKANGEIIDTTVTNTITNTSGNTEKGAYRFGDYQTNPDAKKIEIEELEGAYIEFEYNGMCYQSVEVKTNEDNGNKATDVTPREKFNDDYATITKGKSQNGNYDMNYEYQNHKATLQYGGNYLYGYHKEIYEDDNEIQRYPIAGIANQYLLKANTLEAAPDNLLGQQISLEEVYKEGIEEIPNINLGLKEREMPDISLVQDVQSAEIGLNGYHHTYLYDDRFSELNKQIEQFKKEHPDDDEIFNIGVNFGTKFGPNNYTTTIYSSDIVYNDTDGKRKLEVYVKYKIKLANEASTVNTIINQLYNYFDEDYTILSLVDENGKNVFWDLDKTYQENGSKRILIQPEGGIQLQYNTNQYLYITYKLNDDAIVKILNQDKTLDSTTEIVSYSSYDDNDFTSRYAGVDRDSEPDNATIGNKDTYEDDIDAAPSLILTSNATRTIKGTVWQEDAIDTLLEKEGVDKQRIGNGQYDAEVEKVIKGVQVDLLKVKENGDIDTNPTKLYQAKNSTPTGQVNTNEKGEYEFVGVIPGKYVIRFTYKNSSMICHTDGSQWKTLEEAEGGVEYYKSTIYRTKNTEGNLDTSASEKPNNNLYWYIDETQGADRLSDAKDNKELVTQRTTVEKITYETALETSKIEEISSDTSPFEIRLYCNIDDLENISQYGQNLRYVFDNIDFGIIRRPKQDLILKKEVAYVELSLASGQAIIKGDPRKDDLKYLKFLPNGGVHIELDSEIIQGATLKLTYEIIIDNRNCEVDYNSDKYYYFGIIDDENKNHWKIATVTDLFDYPNSGLGFKLDNNSVWESIQLNELEQGRLSEKAANALANYGIILHTTEFKDMQLGEEKKVQMVLTRLLGNTTDNDFSFDNDVEINTYNDRKMDYTTPGNYDPTDSSTSENDNDGKNVVITGPTGENQNYLPYIMIGITSFMILAVGVIFIKRKVLNK